MKRAYVSLAFFLLLAAVSAWTQSGDDNQQNTPPPVSAQWFAMHFISPMDPWPTQEGIEFSSWRSVSAGIQWSKINTAEGVYDWTYFDRWVSLLEQNQQTILYTVYSTPTWASSCPSCSCNKGNAVPGSCYPPDDLNSGGTGSDKHLKDFVSALMQHVGPGKIQTLEVWNEPNNPQEWGGTTQQLVSMTRDIRTTALSYDPKIKISSPAETGDSKDGIKMLWLADYLADGGGQYVDIIGLHGYVLNPEDIITRVSSTVTDMQQYNQTGKPIWITEGSWCCQSAPIPANQQPGFSFRLVLDMLSTKASRFYLYAFDNVLEGNLWDQTSQKPTPNATAYKLYYDWLVGSTMTQPCQAQSTNSPIWSCAFTKPGGYQAEAIWNTSLSLGHTQNVTVADQYVEYTDVYGHVYQIQNHKVPIGYNPIWLEN